MDSDPLALLDPARGLSRNDLRAGLAAAGRQTLPIALRKSRRRTCEQPMNFSLTDYLRGLSPGEGEEVPFCATRQLFLSGGYGWRQWLWLGLLPFFASDFLCLMNMNEGA